MVSCREWTQKLVRLDAKRLRHLEQRHHGRIATAAFQPAQVLLRVARSAVGKRLLTGDPRSCRTPPKFHPTGIARPCSPRCRAGHSRVINSMMY